MLIQGSLGIFMGRLNDKFGPRLVLTFCGFIFGLGYLLMSQVNNEWQLYLIYGLVAGIGMSGVFVACLSTVARWFVKRRGIMTGIVIAGTGIGTFILPPISTWLIEIYDWRMAYIIVGSAILVIGVLAAQFMKRDPSKLGAHSSSQNTEEKQVSTLNAQGFSFAEALRTSQFWIIAVIFFCLGYTVFTVNVHLVPNITDVGISAVTAANILAVTGVVNAIGCIILGGTVDRIGSKRVCVIGFALIAISFFWLMLIKEAWVFYLYAIIWGLASGVGPVESTLTAELFGMKAHGAIFGVVGFGFTIGAALGPFLTGFLFDVTSNYQIAFFICGVLGLLGFILAVTLRPTRSKVIKIQIS